MSSAFKHLDSDGVTQITAMSWPNAVAGAVQTAKKFGIQNIGTRTLGISTFPNGVQLSNAQSGTSDGYSMMQIGVDTATLSCPWGVTAVELATLGVWGAAQQYGWVVTALNATGESGPSLEVLFTVVTVGNRVTVAWTAVPGATSYKLYRTATPGTYTTPTLIFSGGATTFNDTGAAAGAGAPPAANTSGGASPAYGTPPALGASPVLLASSFYVGQQVFYWQNRVIPVSTPEDGNPRASMRVPAEY